jgi:phosphoribosyl-ATP pyrophosphohydrolase
MEYKLSVLEEVYEIIETRKANPAEDSYVGSLFQHKKGMDKILEKVGEEAFETVIAVKNGDKDRIIAESSDLLFHLLVMLSANGITLEEIADEFQKRRH